MKATVIMNTYNENETHLIQAIESYLKQEGADVELIISSIEGDKNEYIFKQFPVKVTYFPKDLHPGKCPLGSFLQLNSALKLMTGEWFCFASSNDIAKPNKIAQEIDYCQKARKLICYSAYQFADNDLNLGAVQPFYSYDYEKHLHGNFVSDCALIHKSIVDKYLPFKTEYNNYAYWDLWLRVYEGEGNVFVYNPNPTWVYRQSSTSMHVKRAKDLEELSRALADKTYMLSKHGNNKR